jgi:two-component system chemotaxis sensor kinase CheA
MLAHVAGYAEQLAEQSAKQIRVRVLANDALLSPARTNAFFDILVHLVRNAVDHGIERSGAVEIQFFEEADGLYLSVADDGKGIDAARMRRRAIEKRLISETDSLDERAALELVFAPGFSTAERVSEISGRGVGLDAVRAAVEKMNGGISVRNRKTKGAIFEITVPRENGYESRNHGEKGFSGEK